ncbi:hypothetical protein [Sulfuricurvum sp.]|uniref:hypothetical protein n=1 Tax=Sulfuricurvum sp. TaxID=2025608 RepID=UPI002E2FDF7D|nr:hypothetical protein [Sulfuricurvum sp.]HEX5328773.1 hypothetical protein [Sulfuricurvum sp.]
MRRAAYWLVPLIAFAVAVFIVLFLVQINPSAPRVDLNENAAESVSSEGLKGQLGSWISHFAKSGEDDYFYPVNEVTLKLDMGDKNNALELYRLTIKPKSSDELLACKEELKKTDLPYVMQNEEDTKILTVDSTDRAQLQSLVTKLKTYQISATVSPYTEEK